MHRSEVRLPLEYVARPRIRRVRTAVTGRDIFEELHSGTGGCAQSRDTETRAKHVVQMLLFGAVVFAFTNLLQSKKISIESQARIRVIDNDRSVVNPQEQFLRLRAIALALRVLRLRVIALALLVLSFAMPLRVALSRRKPEDFERVLIGIFEIECPDSSGILVPLRQRLRSRGCVLDSVLTQPLVRLVDIRNNDRNVLKPTIIAA